MDKLTFKQAALLRWIIWHINAKGYSPTVAECAEFNDSHYNAVYYQIVRLVRKGYLSIAGTGRRDGSTRRSIMPLADDRGIPLKRVPKLEIRKAS